MASAAFASPMAPCRWPPAADIALSQDTAVARSLWCAAELFRSWTCLQLLAAASGRSAHWHTACVAGAHQGCARTVAEALWCLQAVAAEDVDMKPRIAKSGAIPPLVAMVKAGTPSALLHLCLRASDRQHLSCRCTDLEQGIQLAHALAPAPCASAPLT